MIRHLRSLKYCLQALVTLFILLSLGEIGLRYFEYCSAGNHRPETIRAKLLTESWWTHHRMKPFQQLVLQQVDGSDPVAFVTNSYGLRGSEPVVPKPAETFRILCLGGTTTVGLGIEGSSTFCARLEQDLQRTLQSRVEVINAGVPEFSPLLSYLSVKHELLGLQPDVILMNFDMADIALDYRYRRDAILGEDGTPLACPGPSTSRCSGKGQSWLGEKFALTQWCQERLGCFWQKKLRSREASGIGYSENQYAWLEDSPPDWSVYIQQTLSVLGQLDTLAASAGARMILAAYPAPWQVSPLATSAAEARRRAGVAQGAVYTSDRPFEILAGFANEQGLPFVNTTSAFRAAPQPGDLYLRNAPRLSSLGHELYARELARYFSSVLLSDAFVGMRSK